MECQSILDLDWEQILNVIFVSYPREKQLTRPYFSATDDNILLFVSVDFWTEKVP